MGAERLWDIIEEKDHAPEEEMRVPQEVGRGVGLPFLKPQYVMAVNEVSRLGRVAVYDFLSLLCHVLNRELAETLYRQGSH